MSAPQIDASSSSASSGAALARIRRDSATEDPRESFRTTPAGALPLTADVDQTVESVLTQKRETNPRDLYFAIPRACVGGVIGRGGQLLRDMQAEFNVKVYVEKEEYSGQRIVRLTYLGGSGSSSSIAMTSSSGRTGTVKRSAAESDDDEGESDRHGHDAHKRNRRDESINREAEDQRDLDVNRDNNKDKEGITNTSTSLTRPSNGPAAPAPKRKGTSEGEEGLDGDEGGNVSKKVRDSSNSNSNNTSSCKTGSGDRSTAVEEAGAGGELQQQQAQQQTQQHGEEEEGGDEAESRLKRKRRDATEPVSHTVSSLGAGSDVTVSDSGLPLRALMLCKERIEARIEELLQKQIADAASI